MERPEPLFNFFFNAIYSSVSLRLGNELRLVSFPSELPLMKPWLWCLWGFHCCTGIFVFWSLYFYWKTDTFSSYWMCREPKSWTKAWSTGGCLSLRWVSFTLALPWWKLTGNIFSLHWWMSKKRPVCLHRLLLCAMKPNLPKFHLRDLVAFQYLMGACKKDGEGLFIQPESDKTRGNSFKLKEGRVKIRD